MEHALSVGGNIWAHNSVNIGDNDSGLRANGDGSVQFIANNASQGWWNTSEFRWGKSIAAQNFYDANGYDSKANVYPRGSGAYAAQLDSGAPFYQQYWEWTPNSGGHYVPIVKGRSVRSGQGYPAAVSFGYLLPGDARFPIGCVHIIGDNISNSWAFDANSGEFTSPGSVHAGSAIYGSNGDIYGPVWGNTWLSAWLNNQFVARDNNINTRATFDWVNQNFVKDVRIAGYGELAVGQNANAEVPAGCVVIGAIVYGNWDNNEILKYASIQKFVNGGWYTVGRA